MTKLGSRKLHIYVKVTKMGPINGQRIDYNGLGDLRGQQHIPSKYWPKYPPPRVKKRYIMAAVTKVTCLKLESLMSTTKIADETFSSFCAVTSGSRQKDCLNRRKNQTLPAQLKEAIQRNESCLWFVECLTGKFTFPKVRGKLQGAGISTTQGLFRGGLGD